MDDNQAAEKVAKLISDTIDEFSFIATNTEVDGEEAGIEINAEFVVNGRKYIFTIHEEEQNNYLHQN